MENNIIDLNYKANLYHLIYLYCLRKAYPFLYRLIETIFLSINFKFDQSFSFFYFCPLFLRLIYLTFLTIFYFSHNFTWLIYVRFSIIYYIKWTLLMNSLKVIKRKYFNYLQILIMRVHFEDFIKSER
jgi:hypothetical protein